MNKQAAVDGISPGFQETGAMDPEKAKFIFRNTEAYLRATVEISESLDRKIFNLLSLTFSASLALLGFLLVSLESGFESNLPYSVALLATGSLLLLSLLVVSLMLLHGYSRQLSGKFDGAPIHVSGTGRHDDGGEREPSATD